MLKIQEIREIVRLIDNSSIDEFVYETQETTLTIKKSVNTVSSPTFMQPAPVFMSPPASVVAPPVPVEQQPVIEATKELDMKADNLHKIKSPMVGTFYASSSPEAPSFVGIGDKVGEETIVCIVEAMKLFNEIEAEVQGEIVEVLVQNGQLVEYGQPLFLVKAE